MADVVHRTTHEWRQNVDDVNRFSAEWIHDADTSAVTSVPTKYWLISGDTITEMSQAEKDQVDADEATAAKDAKEVAIKAAMTADPLGGAVPAVDIAGLTLTTNINSAVVDDVTVVTADGTDTKYVMLCYVFDSAADTLAVNAYEKTTGSYAALGADEELVAHLGEWSTPANGTVLTEV